MAGIRSLWTRCSFHLSILRFCDPVPPSLHGVLRGSFPRFPGTMRHCDSPPSFPWVSFPYPSGTSVRSFFVPPSSVERGGLGRGLVAGCPAGLFRGDDGTSHVPG